MATKRLISYNCLTKGMAKVKNRLCKFKTVQLRTFANKKEMLEIINNSNPMTDDFHTGIRSISDVKNAQEVFVDGEDCTPDFTYKDMLRALKTNMITIYSSKPIINGTFVTPSKMIAQDYAGNGKIYSKICSLSDIAWIDCSEGQFVGD